MPDDVSIILDDGRHLRSRVEILHFIEELEGALTTQHPDADPK